MAGSYCTLTDVQGEFRSLTFSGTSTPTDTQVGAFIVQACTEIESKVGLKYQVPVAAVEAMVLLQQIAIALVAGRVKNILPVKTGGADADSGGKGRPGDAMIKWARDTLTSISKGEQFLNGATLVSAADGVVSGIGQAVTGSVGSSSESQQQVAPFHIFRRDPDQW